MKKILLLVLMAISTVSLYGQELAKDYQPKSKVYEIRNRKGTIIRDDEIFATVLGRKVKYADEVI